MLVAFVVAFAAIAFTPVNATAENGGTGTLTVMVLCHNNLFSKEMLISNDLAPDNQVSIWLQPDGMFNDRYLAANYTLVLLDGNGGKPETRVFGIYEDYDTLVTFIGHASAVSHPIINVTPVEICHDERIWHPGFFTCYYWHHRCFPVWHHGYFEIIEICE